jgi:hypothetical protein
MVNSSTPANAPATTRGNTNYPTLELPHGRIVSLYPVFPSGVNGLLYAQLQIGGKAVYPSASNAGGYINLNDTPELATKFTYLILGAKADCDIQAYNLDTVNNHTIQFMIEEEV